MRDNTTYQIYMHTITQTNKSYIGYTSIGIAERFARHVKNAFTYGIDTHFYRALRKYGPENVKSKILATTKCLSDALKLESKYIKSCDTYKNGYNQTHGGTGGKTIDKQKDPAKYEQWYEKKLKKVQGVNNGRYSGFTDDQIIDHAVTFFKDNNTLTRSKWFAYCKIAGMPLSYSKMRWSGKGYQGFLEHVKSELTRQHISFTEDNFKYTKTLKHKTNIGKTSAKLRWYTDGINNTRLLPGDPLIVENNLKPGRTLS